MTIDECITYERRLAKKYGERAKDLYEPYPNLCKDHTKYHEKLAGWLEELKIYKESNISIKNYEQGKAEGYSKAENDYFKKNEEILKQQFDNGENYGYEKGRQDAIDEHFTKIMSFINTNNRGNCDYFIVDQIENYIFEQLKENKE